MTKRPDLKPAPTGYPIKLVRDRTPDVLNESGEPGDLFYGPAPADDRMRWLRLKLAEELGEYLVDGGFKELLDVLAVVEALCVEHGRTFPDAVLALGMHPRGGFKDGVMMYGRHPEFDGDAPATHGAPESGTKRCTCGMPDSPNELPPRDPYCPIHGSSSRTR